MNNLSPFETYRKEFYEKYPWRGDPFDKELLIEILLDILGPTAGVIVEHTINSEKIDFDFETFKKGYYGLCSALEEQPLYHEEIALLIRDLGDVKPDSEYEIIFKANKDTGAIYRKITGLDKGPTIIAKVVIDGELR